jgi:hypothetical protein
MRPLVILAALAGACLLAAGALADGGPGPGAMQGWDGVPGGGGVSRFVALGAGSRTVIAKVQVRGGRVVQFRSLAGNYGIPMVAFDGTAGGLSGDGRTLVLAPPALGATSRFAVLNARNLAVQARIRLRGAFSYDALSPRGRTLYLIEHLSLRRPRYRVRAYDVDAGRLLRDPVADPTLRGSAMGGWPMARATSSGGRWAYTLYRDGRTWFVHALDTARRTAACIGVPRPRGGVVRLVLSRDGRRLSVVRGSSRRLATIDTTTLRLVET